MDAIGNCPSPFLNTENWLNNMVNGRWRNSQLTPNEDEELLSPDRKMASKTKDMSGWAATLSGKIAQLANDFKKSADDTKSQLAQRLDEVEKINKVAFEEIACLKSQNILLQFTITKNEVEAERKLNKDIIFTGLEGSKEVEAFAHLNNIIKETPEEINSAFQEVAIYQLKKIAIEKRNNIATGNNIYVGSCRNLKPDTMTLINPRLLVLD